jgi:UDPglucose 6-dehydrogenase
MTIGFIGQGFIGKSYADDFEKRGYAVVRYGLQPEYVGNKEKIAECDVVFIAVNAATVPAGTKRDDGHPAVKYDDTNVRSTPALTKPGAIVVIKSTLPPGMTKSIQEQYPDRIILHSPEFLLETTAAKDASSPERNIIGIPVDDEVHRSAAEKVMAMLPKAPYELITPSINAELIKYGGNAFLFAKIVFANMFFQLAEKNGGDWEVVRTAIGNDPRIGPSHMDLHLKDDPANVFHRRGAGRSCFIKDWAAFSEMFAATFPEDTSTIQALRGFEYKNAELLREFDRYVDLLEGVYGPGMGKK